VIVFSDLHLNEESFETCEMILNRLCKDAAKDQQDLACLGDFMHTRYYIPVKFLYMIEKVIGTHLDENPKLKFLFLPGNHDLDIIDGKNSLSILGFHKNIIVFNEPQWTKQGLWIPYQYTAEGLLKAFQLKKLRNAAPVAYLHHGIEGALLSNLKKDTDGVGLQDIPTKFKKIYLGHYHKHQSLGHATYIGSPYQTTWNEMGQEKGYVKIDDEQPTRWNFHQWRLGPDRFRIEWIGEGPIPVPENYRDGYDIVQIKTLINQEDAKKARVAEQLKAAGLEHNVAMSFEPKVRKENRLPLDPSKSKMEMVDDYGNGCELPQDFSFPKAKEILCDVLKEEGLI